MPYPAPRISPFFVTGVVESVKNRTLGSIFIVAGTTIGAGMLAMPLAAAGVGFSVTLGLLIGLWALMCYTALLLLEVYQHVPADTGLGSLAKRYLGRYGQWLTGFSMMFLMYALTAAYISGAGELLASSINNWLGATLSPAAGVLLFTFVAGGVVCVGTSLVDLFNRFLFSAKIIFLVIMLALLTPHIHKVNLLTLPLQQGLALSAIPVIFTSFGFHGSVPSIVSYMNGNIRRLRWVFMTGSAIPLVAYIFWQLATLGSIDSPTFRGLLASHAGLNGLLQALREVVASPHVELAVHLFADLALATSFLGVALGLFDYLADLFQRRSTVSGRLQPGLIPRHVCAPYLLCGDPRCLSTSEDKAKLLHASDEPPLQTSSFRLRLEWRLFYPRSLRCELLRFSQLPPQYDLNDFASRSRIRSTPVLVYRGDASRQSAFVPAD